MLHLGVLIGDFIPHDDLSWQIYILDRQIAALITSISLYPGYSRLLRSLEGEHHILVRDVFKQKLKPKDHLGIHLHTVMDEVGPPINIWAMRNEGKHQESKISANSSHPKHQVIESIAIKHQLKLACLIHEGQIFKSFKDSVAQLTTFKELNVPFSKSFSKYLDDEIKLFSWIERNGTKYVSGVAICIEECENQPVFGEIRFICEWKKRSL